MPMTALTGTRLRERRLAAGLRQSDLADRAGISPSYLNLIEHNRRNVTPEVLARLAAALGVDPQALAQASAGVLADDLRAAAAALPLAEAEVARVEDLIGRFPGWAALTAALHGRASSLERAVAALNDRLAHDPHLSDALHELLSALSGVRATAAILAETPDLAADWQARFHRNLYQDSERLAGGAEALVAYLDRSDAPAEDGAATPQDEVEGWLAAQGWHLAEVEAGTETHSETGAPQALEAGIAALASGAARALARAHLAQVGRDAVAMPLAAFQAALGDLGPDPARLADAFGTDILTAMRRIALLPGAAAGLVTCDASGTLVFRKPAQGFALPRFGAACPLWPLYAALGRPGTPVEALVETPGPARPLFRALAYAAVRLPQGFAGPELREAAMLILPETAPRGSRPVLALGSTCRICPRAGCPARREPSILGEAAR